MIDPLNVCEKNIKKLTRGTYGLLLKFEIRVTDDADDDEELYAHCTCSESKTASRVGDLTAIDQLINPHNYVAALGRVVCHRKLSVKKANDQLKIDRRRWQMLRTSVSKSSH